MNYWSRIKQSWRATSAWNKLLVCLTAVIAGANGFYTYYAKKQFMTMSGQLQQMQSTSNQTDQLICLYQQQLTELQKQADAARSQVAKLEAGVKQTARLASAANDANRIAKQAFEVQTRPWIDVPEHIQNAKPNAWSSDSPSFVSSVFKLALHNFGKSPAVVAEPHFVFANLNKSEIRFWKVNLRFPDLCANPETRFKVPVFPDVKEDRSIQAFTESNEDGNRTPPYNLSGCIVYYGATGGGPYVTRVVYYVNYSSDLKTINMDRTDIEVQ